MPEPFFNKLAGLRPEILLKERLWYSCFLVNFAKFLRTPFLHNISGPDDCFWNIKVDTCYSDIHDISMLFWNKAIIKSFISYAQQSAFLAIKIFESKNGNNKELTFKHTWMKLLNDLRSSYWSLINNLVTGISSVLLGMMSGKNVNI